MHQTKMELTLDTTYINKMKHKNISYTVTYKKTYYGLQHKCMKLQKTDRHMYKISDYTEMWETFFSFWFSFLLSRLIKNKQNKSILSHGLQYTTEKKIKEIGAAHYRQRLRIRTKKYDLLLKVPHLSVMLTNISWNIWKGWI